MTPQEQELAKKRALAKARARARAGGEAMVSDQQLKSPEVLNGSSGQRQQAPVQGQLDQVAMFGKLDKAIKGNPGRVYAAGGQITNATTFGAYDRLMAGVDQLYSRTQGESDRSYSDSLSDVRSSRQEMREMHPVSSGAGDVAGLIAGGFGIDDLIRGGVDRSLAKLPQAKNAFEKAGRYGARLGGLAADGAAQYAAWTLGARAANNEAEEARNVGAQERLEMLDPTEAAISAAAGPAMSGMYRGGRAVVTGRATPKNVPGGGSSAPALEEIQAMKSQAYQDAEALGVAYTPDAYANMVAKIENTLEQSGADPQLNASVTSMLNAMQKRVGDQPITMQTLDKVRQQVRENVISPAHRAARDGDIRLGNIIIDEIDEFIASGVGAVSNNGQAGGAAIQKARALNSVWRKSQALQDAVENAQLRAASTGSGGNFENALRQEIRKIYQNPKKVAGFSEMERKAMRAVIEGDMGQNILRNIGKLSPQGNGLMAALGVGTTAANPVLAPVWLGAMGAKHLAQRGIKNKFDQLDEMVREGANNAPMKNITPPKDAPSGTGGLKDKAIDATALGIATVPHAAGKATAQEAPGQGLEAAQQRIGEIESSAAQIEADLNMLNDVNADPSQLQLILQRRVSPDLVVDGVIGPQTRQAINAMRTQLVNERDKMRVELDAARQRATELEQREIYSANSRNGMIDAALNQVPLVGTAIGAAIGLRGRGGAVKKSQIAANALEQQSNKLLNANPMARKSVTGPNSLNQRAANLNEFWRLGGAGENVPFKTTNKGEWRPRTNALNPSSLYQGSKNPFRTTDVGFVAGGLGESALATQYLSESKEALAQAEVRLQQAEESGNLAAYEQAMAQVKHQELMIQVWTGMQRLGLGVAGFRAMGALKSPYATARPNLGGAERERALLLQHINKGKAKPAPKPDAND